jgi:hypothetical protein
MWSPTQILRELEPLNKGRGTRDRITYNTLWVHAKRHYDTDAIVSYWTARMDKQIRTVFGEWGVALLNRQK